METVAFRMTLKTGMHDEYERRHREIWLELAAALTDAGIRDYWIFLDESTGHLFASYKRTDIRLIRCRRCPSCANGGITWPN